ncbi:unnamed protein product, partial [Mycena citricolor]
FGFSLARTLRSGLEVAFTVTLKSVGPGSAEVLACAACNIHEQRQLQWVLKGCLWGNRTRLQPEQTPVQRPLQE